MTLLMAEALDLPWRMSDGPYVDVLDKSGRTLLLEGDYDSTPMMNFSDVQIALIVRAVNAHEALVAMVEALIGALRDEDDSFDVKYDARKLLASLE